MVYYFKIMAEKKRLLLHSCCAPCYLGAENHLRSDYDTTIFWFNPNIFPKKEFDKRFEQFHRISPHLKIIAEFDYEHENRLWDEKTAELKDENEGGKRCEICIKHRLERTAKIAAEHGFPLFSTTLSVSPHKNVSMINRIGNDIQQDAVTFLDADYKKNDGYLWSIRQSSKFKLYRQNYCGCKYSMKND